LSHSATTAPQAMIRPTTAAIAIHPAAELERLIERES
jgi:hypothetical protein